MHNQIHENLQNCGCTCGKTISYCISSNFGFYSRNISYKFLCMIFQFWFMKLIISLWFSLVSYHLVSLDDQRQDMDTIDHEHFSLLHVELEKLNVWNKRCYTLAGGSCNPNPCGPLYNKSGFLDTWFPWIKKTRIIKDMRPLCNVVWIFHHRWWWNHNIIIL